MQQSAANPQLQSNRHGGREFESQLTRGKVTATTRTRFNFFAADRSQPRTLVQRSEEHVVRNDEAPGSKPGFSTNEILFAPSWSSIVVTRLS